MSRAGPAAPRRLRSMLRSPMAWIALALALAMLASAAMVGKDLYASTSLPWVLNPR